MISSSSMSECKPPIENVRWLNNKRFQYADVKGNPSTLIEDVWTGRWVVVPNFAARDCVYTIEVLFAMEENKTYTEVEK